MSVGLAHSVAAASLVAVLVAGQARAEATEAYPTLGLEIRNGDIVSLEAGGIVVFGSASKLPRPVIASLRGELAVGGASAGIGLAIAGTDKPHPGLRDVLFGGLVLVEVRIERMYGPTSWSHTTYAGPQVTLYPSIAPKLSLGWMAAIHDTIDNHLQVGVGFGF